MSNKELAEEFKIQTVESSFLGNIWGAYLADMELLSKFNKGIRFL